MGQRHTRATRTVNSSRDEVWGMLTLGHASLHRRGSWTTGRKSLPLCAERYVGLASDATQAMVPPRAPQSAKGAWTRDGPFVVCRDYEYRHENVRVLSGFDALKLIEKLLLAAMPVRAIYCELTFNSQGSRACPTRKYCAGFNAS